ncbi:MAG: hypothetical protein QOI45_2083 [Thermoleophilaceae bacterium]|nr:hypothetical protein [Thermoleophilaceae bacterium]MEA2455821.1 hypothetical protein [Thermoleophilaceae bacterium]
MESGDVNGLDAPDPESATVGHFATVLTATPSLRAKFFADPTGEIGKRLPPRRFWDYGPRTRWPTLHWIDALNKRHDRRDSRVKLAESIFREIARKVDRKQLAATVNTDAIFEEFFAPIVRVSQRSFTSVFLLSWAAFLVGVGLIASGVVIAFVTPTGTNSTVVAAVFGGSGAVSALGAVYAMAKEGIREATLDHARLRVVLTAVATQLGQLRSLAERTTASDPEGPVTSENLASVTDINVAIAMSISDALELIPLPVDRQPAAQAGDEDGYEGARRI